MGEYRVLAKYLYSMHCNLSNTNGHEADLDLPRWPHKIKNFDKA